MHPARLAVGLADLRLMQELVQRTWSPDRRSHVGDLAWGYWLTHEAGEQPRIALWQDGTDVIGWAWAEASGSLEWLADPGHSHLLPDMLDWFESVTPAAERSCLVMEGDDAAQAALQARGYRPQPGGPFFTRHRRDLTDLPAPELPAGFRLSRVGPGQAAKRAAAHREGWSDFGSRLSAASYAGLMGTYPYRAETDLVVTAPGGEWVASALGWYDDANAVGLVEPVSCRPAYRRRGLARAVNVALLHAFAELGGSCAVILPRGDENYPAPGLLYRGIGYAAGPRTIRYLRRLPGAHR